MLCVMRRCHTGTRGQGQGVLKERTQRHRPPLCLRRLDFLCSGSGSGSGSGRTHRQKNRNRNRNRNDVAYEGVRASARGERNGETSRGRSPGTPESTRARLLKTEEEEIVKGRHAGESRPRRRKHQQTIAKPFTLSGVGLHSGRWTEVTVRPARAKTGRVFLASLVVSGSAASDSDSDSDSDDFGSGSEETAQVHPVQVHSEPAVPIRAHLTQVEFPATLATVLQSDTSSPRACAGPGPAPEASPTSLGQSAGAAGGDGDGDEIGVTTTQMKIQLTEHLLSALEGCGVHNCVIEIKGKGERKDQTGLPRPRPRPRTSTSTCDSLEVPILDGSALPWVEEILCAGLVDALDEEGHPVDLQRTLPCITHEHEHEHEHERESRGDMNMNIMPGEHTRQETYLQAHAHTHAQIQQRVAQGEIKSILDLDLLVPQQDQLAVDEEKEEEEEEEEGGLFIKPITVTEACERSGEVTSFVSFYPGGSVTRVSYGIDFCEKAQVIGKQWFSWCPEEEDYTQLVAPARTFCCSEDIPHMREMGLIKGGSEECAMIANGNEWVNSHQVRFKSDEQARHKILDLVGDLALIAQDGNAALPLGHIVAYKAGHNLHLKFAKQLVKRLSSRKNVTI